MCLAPEVDLVAGAAITVFAIDAIRHSREGRTLPLALLPAVFAVHTFTSAVVWWGARGVVPASVGDAAASFFMFIAFVFLPIYVPLSVLALEPRGWRRDALFALAGAGAVSAIDYLAGLIGGRGGFVTCDYYIDYTIDGVSSIAGVLYLLATCGALLLSGQRPLFIWGIVNAVAVGILSILAARGLPSLWCFLAACTSFFVAWFLRHLDAARAAGEPAPWEEPEPVR